MFRDFFFSVCLEDKNCPKVVDGTGKEGERQKKKGKKPPTKSKKTPTKKQPKAFFLERGFGILGKLCKEFFCYSGQCGSVA